MSAPPNASMQSCSRRLRISRISTAPDETALSLASVWSLSTASRRRRRSRQQDRAVLNAVASAGVGNQSRTRNRRSSARASGGPPERRHGCRRDRRPAPRLTRGGRPRLPRAVRETPPADAAPGTTANFHGVRRCRIRSARNNFTTGPGPDSRRGASDRASRDPTRASRQLRSLTSPVPADS